MAGTPLTDHRQLLVQASAGQRSQLLNQLAGLLQPPPAASAQPAAPLVSIQQQQQSMHASGSSIVCTAAMPPQVCSLGATSLQQPGPAAVGPHAHRPAVQISGCSANQWLQCKSVAAVDGCSGWLLHPQCQVATLRGRALHGTWVIQRMLQIRYHICRCCCLQYVHPLRQRHTRLLEPQLPTHQGSGTTSYRSIYSLQIARRLCLLHVAEPAAALCAPSTAPTTAAPA